jgi:hypothetical protein
MNAYFTAKTISYQQIKMIIYRFFNCGYNLCFFFYDFGNFLYNQSNSMPPIKVKRRHLKHGRLDKIAGFIKLDRPCR